MSANIYCPDPIYYVYAYIRDSDHTPYYIGKGKGSRAWSSHKFIKTPTDSHRIIIISYNLTELGAFAIERRLIRWYGRKDNNTGILRNLTDGGEGVSGYIATSELRYEQSKRRTGVGNAMYGKTHTDIIKQKQSDLITKMNLGSHWYNNGKENAFRKYPPSEEWILGRLNQKPTTSGYKYYNNGTENRLSLSPPYGDGWVRGMLPKKKIQ